MKLMPSKTRHAFSILQGIKFLRFLRMSSITMSKKWIPCNLFPILKYFHKYLVTGPFPIKKFVSDHPTDPIFLKK